MLLLSQLYYYSLLFCFSLLKNSCCYCFFSFSLSLYFYLCLLCLYDLLSVWFGFIQYFSCVKFLVWISLSAEQVVLNVRVRNVNKKEGRKNKTTKQSVFFLQQLLKKSEVQKKSFKKEPKFPTRKQIFFI